MHTTTTTTGNSKRTITVTLDQQRGIIKALKAEIDRVCDEATEDLLASDPDKHDALRVRYEYLTDILFTVRCAG